MADETEISVNDVMMYIRLNHPKIVAEAINHCRRAQAQTVEALQDFDARE